MNSASNVSPARMIGEMPGRIIRSCVDWMSVSPVPNRPMPAARDRDDTEAGQRIIERHFDRRVAVRIERDRRLPQQQRVEQLARDLPPAATARRHCLQSVMSFADDLHLRGRGVDLVGAPPHHRVEQLPAVVVRRVRAGPRRPRRARLRCPGRRRLPRSRSAPRSFTCAFSRTR